MKIKIISGLLILLFIGSGYAYYNYYYVQTLWLSDIVNTESSSLGNIVIKIIDFDTGITRHELNVLMEKVPIWDKEITRIERMQNGYEKERDQQILLQDMLKDPVMRKITQKLISFGFNFVGEFLKSLI